MKSKRRLGTVHKNFSGNVLNITRSVNFKQLNYIRNIENKWFKREANSGIWIIWNECGSHASV